MNDTVSQILVAAIIWISAMGGFFSSLSCSGSPRILALGNTFGGGVLLAAGLVHLTNDAFGEFSDLGEDTWPKQYEFPWATFFVSLGFLLTLCIEETVLHIIARTEAKHTPSCEKSSESSKILPKGEELGNESVSPILLCDASIGKPGSPCPSSKVSSLSAKMTEAALQQHEGHDHGAGDVIERGMAIAIVFLLAISCHSFLAGLGIGAMSGSAIWTGMVAVVAHKGLAAFTLATCFIKAGCSKVRLTFYILLFSIVTPLGILCGSLMSNAGEPTVGVLVGLAGGTFLYIGVVEVISKEMENPADKFYKLMVLILGWGMMSALAIWV